MIELGKCFHPGCERDAIEMIGDEERYTFACEIHRDDARQLLDLAEDDR